MAKKKTFEEFKNDVLINGNDEYMVEPPYINSKTKMKFTHITCGKSFMMKPNAFLSGQRCPNCGRKSSTKKRTKTHSEFVSEVNKYYGNGEYTIIGKYVNSDTPVKIKHNKCGTIYESRPADLIRGHGCPSCAYKTRAVKIGNAHRDSLEHVTKSINSILGSEYIVLTKSEDYTGNRQKLDILHKSCGNVYKARYSDIYCSHNGCPFCNRISKAEDTINNILSSEFSLKPNVDYKYGYVIDDLKYKSKLHLGFYFPKLKIAIEYDGIQHYLPTDFFGGMKTFNELRQKDILKDQYCLDNHIFLMRIPYTITSYSSLKSLLKKYLAALNSNI